MAQSQRTRLLAAVVAVVGDEGYATASVARVAYRAGVSSATFYRHFANRDDCLLAAVDASLDWILEGLEEAIAAEPDWARGVQRGLRALLDRVASEPQLARVWFVELYALDAAGAERRADALERLEVALRPPWSRAPSATGVREEIIAGGVWNALQKMVVSGSLADLSRLVSALHYHVLVYYPAGPPGTGPRAGTRTAILRAHAAAR